MTPITDPHTTVALGLTSEEAAARLRRDGPNTLPPPERPGWMRRFARQLTHFFAVMLWVAAALAWVGGMPPLALAIAGVVVVNAVFAFSQETRAEHAAERLRALLPTAVTVRRDGQAVRIDASAVVAGDVLLLEDGDRIPADGVVLRATPLLVDTSLLTGESVPVRMDVGDRVPAGAFVVEGSGAVEVEATGPRTRLASIARLTTGTPSGPSPLEIRLRVVVRTISRIALVTGVGCFLLSLLLGNGLTDGFVFAVGVTVALVPEALLPTVTLSLVYGAERMAERHVLVRSLEAVETLGSTTFICTDKTGTLTLNQMSVVRAWLPEGTVRVHGGGYGPVAEVECTPVSGATDDAVRAGAARLGLAAARCSSGHVRREGDRWMPHGDPMEAALEAFAWRLGADPVRDAARRPERCRWSFDPRRRRMSVHLDGEVVVKGAPDSVLALCRPVDGVAPALDELAAVGLRVLAVARRDAPTRPGDAAEAERDLELLGLVGLEDPPRTDVSDSMVACRRAGISIAMVTGDHPVTALAIAQEVGLAREGAPVLTGDELPEDLDELGALVDHDGAVIARVSPEDKLRIARALRRRGHVLAMTGDGVNDGPALHEADIGVAMGASGTDVAREAADLVLLDDHFSSIVAGVEQGRATFVNIRRFLTYHLTDNVAELVPFVVWVLSGGRVPLALGVLQILAVDIGTDTLTAVALGAEPPSAHLLEGPPVGGALMNRTVLRRAFGVLGPTIAAMSMAAFAVSLWVGGWRFGDPDTGAVVAAAAGATFITIVFAQKANAFACRSATRRPGEVGWTTNRLLFVTMVLELGFAATVLLVPFLADLFDQAPPPWQGMVVAVASAPVLLAVDAADKAARRRWHATAGHDPGPSAGTLA